MNTQSCPDGPTHNCSFLERQWSLPIFILTVVVEAGLLDVHGNVQKPLERQAKLVMSCSWHCWWVGFDYLGKMGESVSFSDRLSDW